MRGGSILSNAFFLHLWEKSLCFLSFMPHVVIPLVDFRRLNQVGSIALGHCTVRPFRRVVLWLSVHPLLNHSLLHPRDYLIFFFFAISWATPTAYGGSQARGLIRAVATSLRQSRSKSGSKPHLQPVSQLTAMPDP